MTKEAPVADTMDADPREDGTRKKSLEGFEGTGRELAEPQVINPIEALGDPDWEQKQRQVIRRLDLTFMPIMWILAFHNHLDRNNIAQARLTTFEEDIGLEGTQFSSAISVLTAGYMIGQIPSNMLITRIRPGLYVSACAIIWSLISACTALVKNWSQLMAVRFLLGLAEAPFFPGIIYIMSSWYTRGQMARRVAFMYTATSLAHAFSGLISAAVFSTLEGRYGLHSWQWLFIVEAVSGGAFGLLGPFLIPDYPTSTTGAATIWLTEDQRKVAAASIAADRVSEPTANASVFYGLKLVLTDFKTWIFNILGVAISYAYAWNNFYPSIVRGFNMGTRVQTVLLTAPPFFITAITAYLLAWSSDHRKERGWHMAPPLVVSLIGYIISAATLNNPVRYFASFLYIGGSFSANPLLMTWIATTLGRTPEKRAAGIAFCNVFSFIGNLTNPFFFPDKDAPRYLPAMLIMGAFSAVTVGCVLFMKWHLIKENRKLKEAADKWNGVCSVHDLEWETVL